MSAFSRGLFLSGQFFPARSVSRKAPIPKRFFNCSSLLFAAKKATPRALPPNQILKSTLQFPKAAPAPSMSLSSYHNYATMLAQKSTPTLIYTAPSHFSYMTFCYSGAVFCFAYSAWNFNTCYVNPPEGLAPWIRYAYGLFCVLMAAGGGYLLLGPTRIIRSITAFPSRALSPTQAPVLRIEVELKKMFPLPFFPARVLTTTPADLAINHPLMGPVKSLKGLTPTQKAEAILQKEKEMQYERDHLLSSPFRHMSRALHNIFITLRRSWTREGFAPLAVNKQKYKLDVTGGWALDKGRAIDRLVQIKPF